MSIRKWSSMLAAGAVAMSLCVQPAMAQQNDVLLRMYEEERMAHDLYVALGEKWGSRKFDNISRAEVKHQELMGQQLDRLGMSRPEAMGPGNYQFDELDVLYADWLRRGLTSQAEAFRVGAELERQDIADLEAAKEQTTDAVLQAAYDRLIAGSKNHLAAFEKTGKGEKGQQRQGHRGHGHRAS